MTPGGDSLDPQDAFSASYLNHSSLRRGLSTVHPRFRRRAPRRGLSLSRNLFEYALAATNPPPRPGGGPLTWTVRLQLDVSECVLAVIRLNRWSARRALCTCMRLPSVCARVRPRLSPKT